MDNKKDEILKRRSKLSSSKRELLEKRLRGEVDSHFQLEIIPRRSQTSPAPLSFAQQRLWFLAQLEPDSPFYNVPAAIHLQGQLNLVALGQSLNEILRRHEALRTHFKIVEGQPVVVISSMTPLLLPVIDISELPFAQREAQARQLALAEAQQLFDLKSDPLLRVKLVRINEQEHIVLFTLHHIGADGWSIGVLVREVAMLYEAFCSGQPSPLPELPIQYADFAAWQRQWLQGEVLETQMSYWRLQLEGAPAVLELPTDHTRPVFQTSRGASYSFKLSQELSVALKRLSQQEGCTLFMTLLAAFKTLLLRYTGSEDIVLGSPIANRNQAETEGLIGFFANTLVLRTDLSGNPTFQELLKRVQDCTLGAYTHQGLPFDLLVEKLQPQRDSSHTPLFQVMFVLQNASLSELELPGLTLSPLASDNCTAKFDLTLDMAETAQGLVGILEYNTDLFEADTIRRMAGHLQTLLSGIVANPQRRLKELPLLTQAEKAQLVEWNDTQAEYPQQKCIHQLFEAQVERTPDAVAVVFEDEQLTYCELNERANQLAHYLRSLRVGPEVLVGICVERSLEMVVGLLGILKAGGAYVPLDPAYPKERLALMLQDAQMPVILTKQSLLNALPKNKFQILCLDTDWTVIAQESQENLFNLTQLENLAYLIYTSGSTGTPKGVMIQHRSLVNYIETACLEYEVKSPDRVLQFASISFDAAAEEIFPCLLQGATLVLRTDAMLSSTPKFLQQCHNLGLTVLDLPTAFWHQVTAELSTPKLTLPEALRLVIIGGEKAEPSRLETWQQQVGQGVRLVNSYGPTETTIVATISDLCESISVQMDGRELPIGQAIRNIQTYVLDFHLQLVPVGVPGELYIGGVGVARGYFNRPQLTALAFIPNPYSTEPGTRLYKTGDLVRYRPDGNIEFLGRIDNQVKIRGFRIELREIEALLSQHPAVREAVVVSRQDEADYKRLVAYVVPNIKSDVVVEEQTPPREFTQQASESQAVFDSLYSTRKTTSPQSWSDYANAPLQAMSSTQLVSLLRQHLGSKLPEYMMPSAFVMLNALPLTPNGKVDRRALPSAEGLRPELEAAYVMPQTELEQTIARVWQKALNVEKVGIYDNFFELGGHSLLMVQIHSQLREIFKTDLSMLEMFRYPTISSLAEYFSQVNNKTSSFRDIDIQTEKLKEGKYQQSKRLQKMKLIGQ